MGKSNKLTPEQNQFACQHLSLVKVFLFKNHLDQEFYDVVIFGYLDAVREYLENPELSRFRFSSIAWRKMKYCMIKEFLYLECPKRKASMGIYCEGCISSDMDGRFTDGNGIERASEILDAKQQLLQLLPYIKPKEKEVIYMRAEGYTYREIAEHCNITIRGVSSRLTRMRKRLKRLGLMQEGVEQR